MKPDGHYESTEEGMQNTSSHTRFVQGALQRDGNEEATGGAEHIVAY